MDDQKKHNKESYSSNLLTPIEMDNIYNRVNNKQIKEETYRGSLTSAQCLTRPQYESKSNRDKGRGREPGTDDAIVKKERYKQGQE